MLTCEICKKEVEGENERHPYTFIEIIVSNRNPICHRDTKAKTSVNVCNTCYKGGEFIEHTTLEKAVEIGAGVCTKE